MRPASAARRLTGARAGGRARGGRAPGCRARPGDAGAGGLGRRAAPPRRRPVRPGRVRTVTGMLDGVGYDEVDVFGVSLGGVVAQQLARQAPHRVRRLVLAATAPGMGGMPGAPSALLSLATPRRYREPEHYLRIAGRINGGMA